MFEILLYILSVCRYESVVLDWCRQTEALLNEKEGMVSSEDGEIGPRTELEYWRSRMGKLNSIIEQLKGENCRVVLAVLQARENASAGTLLLTDAFHD
eukprot:4051863-Pleurochrysis_carterae.AAC.1